MSTSSNYFSHNATHTCFTTKTQDEYIVITKETWTTSMAISILCLMAFLKLFFFPKVARSTTTEWCCPHLEEYLVPCLFLIFSYLYGLHGISQSLGGLDQQENHLTMYSASVLPLIAGLFAVLVGLNLLKVYSTSKLISRKAFWWCFVLVYYSLAITSAIREIEILGVIDLCTLVTLCGLGFLYVVYVIRIICLSYNEMFHFVIKSCSSFLFIIGFVYDRLYYQKCASYQAFQDCFQQCPLPNKDDVNQKYTINMTIICATIGWAFSENWFPTVQRRKVVAINNHDGNTVVGDDWSVESLDEDLEKDPPTLENTFTDPELGCSSESDDCKKEEEGPILLSSGGEPDLDESESEVRSASSVQSLDENLEKDYQTLEERIIDSELKSQRETEDDFKNHDEDEELMPSTEPESSRTETDQCLDSDSEIRYT